MEGQLCSPEIIVPSADMQKMEPLIPVKPSREEAPTGRGGQQFTRLCQPSSAFLFFIIGFIFVPLMFDRRVNDGVAVEVPNATDKVARDCFRERQKFI